jgi:hypothetical protein
VIWRSDLIFHKSRTAFSHSLGHEGAALPVYAANKIFWPSSSAMRRASAVLPVPAYPNRRNTWLDSERRQFEIAFNAASCCGDSGGLI